MVSCSKNDIHLTLKNIEGNQVICCEYIRISLMETFLKS